MNETPVIDEKKYSISSVVPKMDIKLQAHDNKSSMTAFLSEVIDQHYEHLLSNTSENSHFIAHFLAEIKKLNIFEGVTEKYRLYNSRWILLSRIPGAIERDFTDLLDNPNTTSHQVLHLSKLLLTLINYDQYEILNFFLKFDFFKDHLKKINLPKDYPPPSTDNIDIFSHAISRNALNSVNCLNKSGWVIEFSHLKKAVEYHAEAVLPYLLDKYFLTDEERLALADIAKKTGNILTLNLIYPAEPIFYFKEYIAELQKNEDKPLSQDFYVTIFNDVSRAYRTTISATLVNETCENFIKFLRENFTSQNFTLPLKKINKQIAKARALYPQWASQTAPYRTPDAFKEMQRTYNSPQNGLEKNGIEDEIKYGMGTVEFIKQLAAQELKVDKENKLPFPIGESPKNFYSMRDLIFLISEWNFNQNNARSQKNSLAFKTPRTKDNIKISWMVDSKDIKEDIVYLEIKDDAIKYYLKSNCFEKSGVLSSSTLNENITSDLSLEEIKKFSSKLFTAMSVSNHITTPIGFNRYENIFPLAEAMLRLNLPDVKRRSANVGYSLLSEGQEITHVLFDFENHFFYCGIGCVSLHGSCDINEMMIKIEPLHKKIFDMEEKDIHENPKQFYDIIAEIISLLGKSTPYKRGGSKIVEIWVALIHLIKNLPIPVSKHFQLDCINILLSTELEKDIFLFFFKPEFLSASTLKHLEQLNKDPKIEDFLRELKLGKFEKQALIDESKFEFTQAYAEDHKVLDNFLADKNLKITDKDKNNDNLLMWAIKHERLDIIRKLSIRCFCLSERNKQGKTAMSLAKKTENKAIINILQPHIQENLSRNSPWFESDGDDSDSKARNYLARNFIKKFAELNDKTEENDQLTEYTPSASSDNLATLTIKEIFSNLLSEEESTTFHFNVSSNLIATHQKISVDLTKTLSQQPDFAEIKSSSAEMIQFVKFVYNIDVARKKIIALRDKEPEDISEFKQENFINSQGLHLAEEIALTIYSSSHGLAINEFLRTQARSGAPCWNILEAPPQITAKYLLLCTVMISLGLKKLQQSIAQPKSLNFDKNQCLIRFRKLASEEETSAFEEEYKEKNLVTERGFFSATDFTKLNSQHPTTAAKFVSNTNAYIMVLNSLFISPIKNYSLHPQEEEILFSPGERFIILAYLKEASKHYVILKKIERLNVRVITEENKIEKNNLRIFTLPQSNPVVHTKERRCQPDLSPFW